MRKATNPVIATKLPLLFLKEGKTYIAYTPALDLSASGSTPKKAQENFQTVLKLFIDELVEHGTLDEILREMGWKRQSRGWTPPVALHRIFTVSLRVPLAA